MSADSTRTPENAEKNGATAEPSSGAVPAEPPKGRADAPAEQSDDIPPDLWAVSFADDDDRELRTRQIARALRANQIDAETLVWRPELPDWKPLGEVPELKELLDQVRLAQEADAPDSMRRREKSLPAPPIKKPSIPPATVAATPQPKRDSDAGARAGDSAAAAQVEAGAEADEDAKSGPISEPAPTMKSEGAAPGAATMEQVDTESVAIASAEAKAEAPLSRTLESEGSPAAKSEPPPTTKVEGKAARSSKDESAPKTKRRRPQAAASGADPADRAAASPRPPFPSASRIIWIVGVALAIGAVIWFARVRPGRDAQSEPPIPEPATTAGTTPIEPTLAQPKSGPALAVPNVTAPAASTAPMASNSPPSAPSAAASSAPLAKLDRASVFKAVALDELKASRCRSSAEPAGTARVALVIDPDGTVQSVHVVQAPYQGTLTAKCIEKKLKNLKVNPFDGEPETIRVPVVLY